MKHIFGIKIKNSYAYCLKLFLCLKHCGTSKVIYHQEKDFNSQNLTKKTIKMPQKIAKKPQKNLVPI